MTTETVLRINPINYATDLSTITVSELQRPVDFPENQMEHWQHATEALTYAQNNRVNQNAAFFAALLTYEVLANPNVRQSLKDDVWERYQKNEHQAIYDLVLQARTVDLICNEAEEVAKFFFGGFAVGSLLVLLTGLEFMVLPAVIVSITVGAILTLSAIAGGIGVGVGLLLLVVMGGLACWFYESEKSKITQNENSFLSNLGTCLPTKREPDETRSTQATKNDGHKGSAQESGSSCVSDYVGNFFSGIGEMCGALATGCTMGVNQLDTVMPGWGLFP